MNFLYDDIVHALQNTIDSVPVCRLQTIDGGRTGDDIRSRSLKNSAISAALSLKDAGPASHSDFNDKVDLRVAFSNADKQEQLLCF